MAVLPDTDRNRVWRYFMRHNVQTAPFTKDELRAAVDATDSWVDDNAASFNSSLPTAFRTNATAAQKTALLCWVAMRRAGILRVDEDE
jgi:hypothetical protein